MHELLRGLQGSKSSTCKGRYHELDELGGQQPVQCMKGGQNDQKEAKNMQEDFGSTGKVRSSEKQFWKWVGWKVPREVVQKYTNMAT